MHRGDATRYSHEVLDVAHIDELTGVVATVRVIAVALLVVPLGRAAAGQVRAAGEGAGFRRLVRAPERARKSRKTAPVHRSIRSSSRAHAAAFRALIARRADRSGGVRCGV